LLMKCLVILCWKEEKCICYILLFVKFSYARNTKNDTRNPTLSVSLWWKYDKICIVLVLIGNIVMGCFDVARSWKEDWWC
jgi:hypothetical protein